MGCIFRVTYGVTSMSAWQGGDVGRPQVEFRLGEQPYAPPKSHQSRQRRRRLPGFFLLLLASVAILCPTRSSASANASNTVVRFQIQRGTNDLGGMDVELFDQDKPETVRNFLLYVRSGAYSNSFLHRCGPGFIVQGGGFSMTNPLGTNRFSTYLTVTNDGRLTNEFLVGAHLSNTFGTLAMAKIGNDPNSAVSQWYFNLGDNSANLDNQNGGFTVFGRLVRGTNVLNIFNAISQANGIVDLRKFYGTNTVTSLF